MGIFWIEGNWKSENPHFEDDYQFPLPTVLPEQLSVSCQVRGKYLYTDRNDFASQQGAAPWARTPQGGKSALFPWNKAALRGSPLWPVERFKNLSLILLSPTWWGNDGNDWVQRIRLGLFLSWGYEADDGQKYSRV